MNESEIADRLSNIEYRLKKIEKKAGQSQASDGGIGCLGILLFAWVLSKLYEVLERLPEGAS